MKAILSLLIFSLVVPLTTAFGQDESSASSTAPPAGRSGRGGRSGFGGFGAGRGVSFGSSGEQRLGDFSQFANVELPKFDLDFPGGTPGQLVAAIEKASGRPLNAIIPTEFRETTLPALKMNGVTVPQLFQALQMASLRTEPIVTGTRWDPSGNRINSVTYQNTGYGFTAPVTPDPQNPVWYFFVARAGEPPLIEPAPKICRFYQLAPYLENYTIDDITTAIRTGWKMLGDSSPPTMNFHKDTKLLIAVGEPEKLRLIDSALAELRGTTKSGTSNSAPKSAGRE